TADSRPYTLGKRETRARSHLLAVQYGSSLVNEPSRSPAQSLVGKSTSRQDCVDLTVPLAIQRFPRLYAVVRFVLHLRRTVAEDSKDTRSEIDLQVVGRRKEVDRPHAAPDDSPETAQHVTMGQVRVSPATDNVRSRIEAPGAGNEERQLS